MGLPIFYYQAPNKPAPAIKECPKHDSPAAARSSIRRRPSIHRGQFPRHSEAWLNHRARIIAASRAAWISPPDSALRSGPELDLSSDAAARPPWAEQHTRALDSFLDYLHPGQDPDSLPSRVSRIRGLLPTPPREGSTPPQASLHTQMPTITTASLVDGLGDRHLSLSPPADADDIWQAIMNTVHVVDSDLPSTTGSSVTTLGVNSEPAHESAVQTPLSDAHSEVSDSECPSDCPDHRGREAPLTRQRRPAILDEAALIQARLCSISQELTYAAIASDMEKLRCLDRDLTALSEEVESLDHRILIHMDDVTASGHHPDVLYNLGHYERVRESLGCLNVGVRSHCSSLAAEHRGQRPRPRLRLSDTLPRPPIRTTALLEFHRATIFERGAYDISPRDIDTMILLRDALDHFRNNDAVSDQDFCAMLGVPRDLYIFGSARYRETVLMIYQRELVYLTPNLHLQPTGQICNEFLLDVQLSVISKLCEHSVLDDENFEAFVGASREAFRAALEVDHGVSPRIDQVRRGDEGTGSVPTAG